MSMLSELDTVVQALILSSTFQGVIVAVGLSLYGVFALKYLNRARERKIDKNIELDKIRANVQSSIIQSIHKGVINDIYDIHNIYLALFGSNSIGQWEHDAITLLLRKVIVHMSSDHLLSEEDRNLHIDLLKQLITESNALSEKATQTLPFSNTPNPERGLLTDILELAANENNLAKIKLKELAHTITVRQETISQLSEEKGTSAKWAKWGVFGTVFFSAVSIAITIFK